MSRFQKKYLEEVVPALTKEFGYKTTMEVPRITKITETCCHKNKKGYCEL